MIMQFTASKGLRKPVTTGLNYFKFFDAVQKGDITRGDIIEVNFTIDTEGRKYLFMGMNNEGGPYRNDYASAKFPAPEFVPEKPNTYESVTIFSLRNFPIWKKTGHKTPEQYHQEFKELMKEQQKEPKEFQTLDSRTDAIYNFEER